MNDRTRGLSLVTRIVPLCLALVALVLLPRAARALTISPTMTELSLDPGTTIESKLKLVNESSEPITLYTSTANFTARDETGNPFFLFDEINGLAAWIAIEKGPITLAPNEQREVFFSISAPQDAEAGGHYAGIFVSPQAPDAAALPGQSVSINTKLGMLVIVRVNGDITTGSAIREFRILNNQQFFTHLPVSFWYRLRNDGNLHIRPFGGIAITNTFGFRSALITANPTEGAVLPQSTRRFETMWTKAPTLPTELSSQNPFIRFIGELKAQSSNFALGYYTAELAFGNVDTTGPAPTISFWVFPWQLLLTLLIGGILTLLIIRFILKRYNRWIIATYQQKTQSEETKQPEQKPEPKKKEAAKKK